MSRTRTQSGHGQQDASLVGKIIKGQYRIIDRVGKGGMAWIYRAQHLTLREFIAIKILFPHLIEEPELCQRFLEEAQIQFKLKHPNIVAVTDVITEGPLVGIVLEWINGHDLKIGLRRNKKPLTAVQTYALMNPILEAICYAHEKGIVHRDIKPANILFKHDGARVLPKVADFGIAKLLNEADSHTATGSMMGTLEYMSPEQIRDSKAVDQRSDIYSLGVMMYRIASGKLPFRDKNSLNLMRLHEQAIPDLPSRWNQEISPELDELLLRCLEKEPDKRFQTCGELNDALAQLPEIQEVSDVDSEFPSFLTIQKDEKVPTFDDEGSSHFSQHSLTPGVKMVSFSPDGMPTGSFMGSRGNVMGGTTGSSEFFGTGGPGLSAAPTGPGSSHTLEYRLDELDGGGVLSYGSSDSHTLDLRKGGSSPPTGVPVRPGEAGDSQTTDTRKGSSVALPALITMVVVLIGALGFVIKFRSDPKRSMAANELVQADAGPPPARRLSAEELQQRKLLAQLNSLVKAGNEAMTKKDFATAAKKWRQAMAHKGFKKSQYYPRLYHTVGTAYAKRNYLSTSIKFYSRYVEAKPSSKEGTAEYKLYQKASKILKRQLPTMRSRLKKRVSKANTILASLQKSLKRKNLRSAFKIYERLQKTVRSVPEIYQKVARGFSELIPGLSLEVYEEIITEMEPSPELAATLRKEKEELKKKIEKREQEIIALFERATNLAKSRKYKKLRRLLKKNHKKYIGYELFHKKMDGLLGLLAAYDYRIASKLLKYYMGMHKRFGRKGFWLWLTKRKAEIPTYENLQGKDKFLRKLIALASGFKGIRAALERRKVNLAKSRFYRLPKNWVMLGYNSKWKVHRKLSKGYGFGRWNHLLMGLFERQTLHDKQLRSARLGKAREGYSSLEQKLPGTSPPLRVLVGKKAVKGWSVYLKRLQGRCRSGQNELLKANRLYRRKKWKESQKGYERYIKKFPRSHRLKWVKKRIHACQCHRNLPWVLCKKKKKK